MSIVDERRDALQEALRPYADTISKVQRAYFDRPSVALAEKHEIEFDIKRRVSHRYGIPFRSVVFTGSAQLGFSPHKDTEFLAGASDLDIACIDNRLYQEVWEVVVRVTRAFSDLSMFHSVQHAKMLQSQMLRRGMIFLDFMPRCSERTREQTFLDELSQRYRRVFARLSVAVYMNESAFCWKQASALANILGHKDAE